MSRTKEAESSYDMLRWCCEDHMITSRSHQSYKADIQINLPMEIIEQILIQLSFFGSQYAYSAALIHPHLYEALKPHKDNQQILFSQAENTNRLNDILTSAPNQERKTISLLRLGSSQVMQRKKVLFTCEEDQFTFDEKTTIVRLQIGSLPPMKLAKKERLEELCLLQGIQHADYLSSFPNLKRLSLLNLKWESLYDVAELKNLEELFIFKDAPLPWDKLSDESFYTQNWFISGKDAAEQGSKSVEFSYWAIKHLQKKALKNVYMIVIQKNSLVQYCALEKKNSRTEGKINVSYYTFHCKEEWR